MFVKFAKSLVGVMFVCLTSTAGAESSRHRGMGDGDRNDSGFRNYTCRAESVTNEGIFFLGMGRNYGDAYARALQNCTMARQVCTITCSQQVF